MQRYPLILSFLLILSLPASLYSQATVISRPLQKVSLQLRWKHQFQFAGYYAAVHKGFYKEAGLDVTINEGGVKPNVIEEVLENRSEYGVTNSEILLHRLQKKPLVVLAAIFQHSPLVLVSRKDSGIRSPQDLIYKKIKMSRNSRDIELQAMFMNEGISLDSMRIEEGFAKYEHYFDDTISSIAAYLTNQPYYYEQKKIPYNVIFPRTYGIDFYGDCLFTSENELKHHPARVKAFREASLKGWAYAMDNVEEIIDVIISNYKTVKTRDHLLYEAQKMHELILPDLVEIGHINPGRWKHIAKTFEQFGLIQPGYSLKGFIYDPDPKLNLIQFYWIIGSITIIGLLIGVAALILLRFNRRLHKEIKQRKLVESTILQERDYVNSILQWIESMVVVIDLDGYIVTFNKAAEKCSGFSLEEIQKKPFWEILVAKEDQAQVREVILSVKEKSLPLENKNYWVTKDGEMRYIHWYNSVLNKSDGSVEFILCTGLDLTERSEIENALIKSEAHYQSILSDMEEGYFEVDLEGNIQSGNKAYFEMLGFPKDELIGASFRKVMDSKTADVVFEGFNKVFRTRKPNRFLSFDIVRKDQTKRTLEVSVLLKEDLSNKAIGFYGVSRDVTERKRMEQVMIQTEKMMSVGGLAAGMAHEINNPLAIIVQGIQNLKLRVQPSGKKNIEAANKTEIDLNQMYTYLEARDIPRIMDNISAAGMRAAEIITNMLRFARKSDYMPNKADVTELIERTIDLASKDYNLIKKFDFRSVTIQKQFAESLPMLECMEQEIEQVLLNILGNAAQALHNVTDVGFTPTITIRTVNEGNHLRIEVEDNGPGIEEKNKKRIFEPFFTTKPTGLGTGLGLSVSYMIITNNHRGTLEVESEPNHFTRFIIRLPFQQNSG